MVDAATGNRQPAFDQKKIAAGLSRATNTKFAAAFLPFKVFRYTDSKKAVQFQIGDKIWTCRLNTESCSAESLPGGNPNEVLSPDGKWAALLKDHNLWIRPTSGGAALALTKDGVEHYDYASPPGDSDSISAIRHHDPTPPEAMWSPDSRYLLTHRLDERKVEDVFLIQSVPEDGTIRPRLYSWRSSYPGDEHVVQLAPVVFNVFTRQKVDLATPPIAATGKQPDYGALHVVVTRQHENLLFE